MRTGQVCTPNPVTVDVDETVVTAAQLMRERHVGSVVVLEGDRPRAILTDRDLAIVAVAQCADRITTLSVRDVLAKEQLHVAHADEPLWKVLKRMRDRGVRRMPVLDVTDQLVGILSIDDAIDSLAEQLSDIAALTERQMTREYFERR